jgi:amino acid permease
MPRSSASAADYEALPLLGGRSSSTASTAAVTPNQPAASILYYGSQYAHSANGGDVTPVSATGGDGTTLKIHVRRLKDTASPYASLSMTPRSPFEEGFPMMFSSPVPSPRPHRLSFSYTRNERHRQLHVFLMLLMSVVGAGMLSVPYTFLLVPTWEAVAGIVLVGAAMATTSTALLYAHVQLAFDEERVLHIGAGKRFSSFQSIAIVAGGEVFGYVVSVVTAIGIYGGCVGCIRIVRDIAPFMVSIVAALTTNGQTDDAATARDALYLLWFCFVVVVFPLCLLRNLSALRVSSYLGFAFSLYLVAAVVYRSFVALGPTDAPPPAAPVNATEPLVTTPPATVIVGKIFSRLSQSISIYNYAFMMQLNLVPLFIHLRGSFAEPLHTSARKMTNSIWGVSIFCMVLYIVFGVYAKQLYGDTIRGNILLNLEHDPLMAVPLVAVFLTVLLSFPLLFHPLRGVIETLMCSTSLEDIAFVPRLATTAVLLLSQLLLALCVPGIQVVFALTGASSCLLICFVFPVVLFMRLYPWRTKFQRRRRALVVATLWLIVAFFTVTGIDATGFLLSGA